MKENRMFFVVFFMVLASLLLLGKSFQLQIMDESYQDRARAMMFQKNTLYPARGLIYDRNEKLMVANNRTFDLMFTYNQMDPGMDTFRFCQLLGISKDEFMSLSGKNWNDIHYSKSIPTIFLDKIPAETIARFEENLFQFPGFFIQLRSFRDYRTNHAANIIGYISEVSLDKINSSDGLYSKGDYLGSSGLELFYEDILRGKKGSEFVIKDNVGRIVGRYKNGALDSAAVSGVDIYSTIDIDMQGYGEQLMQNKVGSIVAIDPQSGEVLALVSSPSYDPNMLSIQRSRGKAFDSLSNSALRPFYNRAVMAKYPPGSIFKSIVGLIALEDGVIHPNRYIYCGGGYWYSDDFRKCHRHPSPVNVTSAIQHSCNSFFFEIFREIIDRHGVQTPHIGLDELNRNLMSFGLGRKLSIDLPSESSGNLSRAEYYDKLYPKRKGGWKSPTIMSLGIGQGELELTPLQIANLAAIIANNGFYYPPHLVKGFSDTTIRMNEDYTKKHFVHVDPSYFKHVKRGMRAAVEAGTGTNAYIPGLVVCGKTGTSQNPHGEDHSVFYAFAPLDDPKIAIAVLVENAGDGGYFAASISGLMMEKYLKGMISPYKEYLEARMLTADLVELK